MAWTGFGEKFWTTPSNTALNYQEGQFQTLNAGGHDIRHDRMSYKSSSNCFVCEEMRGRENDHPAPPSRRRSGHPAWNNHGRSLQPLPLASWYVTFVTLLTSVVVIEIFYHPSHGHIESTIHRNIYVVSLSQTPADSRQRIDVGKESISWNVYK